MKAADAKAPKFDSKWWTANKAKDVDAKGTFASALDDYDKAQKKFAASRTLGEAGAAAKALDTFIKAAKTAKADPKLGVLQKDTKEALVNYEKIATAALKALTAAARDVDLNADVADLVKRQSKPFRAFCAKEFSTENFNFLVLLSKGVRSRELYDGYVADGAKFQVNVPDTQRAELDALARRTPAASPADWKAAKAWAVLQAEITKVLGADTLTRFRKARATEMLTPVSLP